MLFYDSFASPDNRSTNQMASNFARWTCEMEINLFSIFSPPVLFPILLPKIIPCCCANIKVFRLFPHYRLFFLFKPATGMSVRCICRKRYARGTSRVLFVPINEREFLPDFLSVYFAVIFRQRSGRHWHTFLAEDDRVYWGEQKIESNFSRLSQYYYYNTLIKLIYIIASEISTERVREAGKELHSLALESYKILCLASVRESPVV